MEWHGFGKFPFHLETIVYQKDLINNLKISTYGRLFRVESHYKMKKFLSMFTFTALKFIMINCL
jgi:hypothetical protein